MTDSFLPEPVVVKQPKFTRVEGSRHSYAITAHHVEKLKRGSLRPNILLQYLMRPPPQLAAKCDSDQRSSFQSFVSRSGCLGRSNRGKVPGLAGRAGLGTAFHRRSSPDCRRIKGEHRARACLFSSRWQDEPSNIACTRSAGNEKNCRPPWMCVENCTTRPCKSVVRPGRLSARVSTTQSRRSNSQASKPFERTFARFTVKFCKMRCAGSTRLSGPFFLAASVGKYRGFRAFVPRAATTPSPIRKPDSN